MLWTRYGGAPGGALAMRPGAFIAPTTGLPPAAYKRRPRTYRRECMEGSLRRASHVSPLAQRLPNICLTTYSVPSCAEGKTFLDFDAPVGFETVLATAKLPRFAEMPLKGGNWQDFLGATNEGEDARQSATAILRHAPGRPRPPRCVPRGQRTVHHRMREATLLPSCQQQLAAAWPLAKAHGSPYKTVKLRLIGHPGGVCDGSRRLQPWPSYPRLSGLLGRPGSHPHRPDAFKNAARRQIFVRVPPCGVCRRHDGFQSRQEG